MEKPVNNFNKLKPSTAVQIVYTQEVHAEKPPGMVCCIGFTPQSKGCRGKNPPESS